MKTAKKISRILGTILLIFLIAVVIVMFNARLSGEAPNIFGYQVYRVITPSMEPTLMVGDVILVKETSPENIKNGDIITYKGEEGEYRGKTITHMVVEEPQKTDGVYSFTTKGVANYSNDPTVYEDQVLGVYVRTLPFIDKLYNFFLQPYGLLAFVVLIVALFGYELISLILSYKSLDEPDDSDSDNEQDTTEKD